MTANQTNSNKDISLDLRQWKQIKSIDNKFDLYLNGHEHDLEYGNYPYN